MKTALVIGGSRFVGPNLVKLLIREGYKVILFNRGTRSTGFEQNEVQHVRGDRNVVNELEQVAALAPDIVFDTCCYEPPQAEQAIRLFSNQVNRYVYISSVAVYREPDVFPIVEEAPLGSWPMWGDYGLNKARTDQTFFQAYQTSGFPVTIVRPPYVLGSNNHVEREAFFVSRLLNKIPIVVPGNGQALIHFTFADQVAEAMLRLAEASETAGQAYNCATDQAIPLLGFIQLCAHFLGVEAKVLFADPDQFHFKTEPFQAVDLSPFANSHVVLSNQKLKETTKLGFVPLKEKLQEVVGWYANNSEKYPVKLRAKEREVLAHFGYAELCN